MNKQLEKVYNYLFEKLIDVDSIAENLRLAALGGRICYSSDNIQNIIETDRRVNGDEYLDYLKRLSKKGHTSVFSHNVIMLDGSSMSPLFSLDELIGIDDNVQYVLDFMAPGQQFPTDLSDVHIERTKKAYFTLLKMVLGYYLKGIPHTPDSLDITINFRTILELAKQLGREDELWDKLSSVESPKIEPVETIHTKYGSSVHLFRYSQASEKGEVLTFVLEGVSRVLTHQLVRHKLDTEYSQRSHRYTKIKYNDNVNEIFVIPQLDYIDDEKMREQYLGLIEVEYANELQVYQLIRKKNNKDKVVRAEDARYIIGEGIRTTIMQTMYSKETIDNFINLRADSHAQWEIREIAEIIRDLREKYRK